MEIKILYKKYQCNKARTPNEVYFEVDGQPLKVDIIYIPERKANYLLESKESIELEEYITSHYDISMDIFLEAFFDKLRTYSNYRNLNPVTHFNVSNIKYHDKESDK